MALTDPINAKTNKAVAFKNNAIFINCISKINGVQIDNAEDLDVLMPIYNSLKYRKTIGSLWNYYRDEPGAALSPNSESFQYETSITRNTNNISGSDEAGKNKTEVGIPLKHLIHFWRSLNIPLINCEVELILTWSKNCALADITVRAAGNDNAPPAIVALTGLESRKTNTNLYIPVVTLSKETDTKLLKQLKSGFIRTIKWNKYRSQMTVQLQNNNLDQLFN